MAKWHTGEAVRDLIGIGRTPVEAAALEMNTSSTTLYRWFLRGEDWPEHLVSRVADYLGVRKEWLESGRGAQYPPERGALHANDRHLDVLMERYLFDVQRVTKRYTREIIEAIRTGRTGDDPGATPLSTTRD